MSKITEIDPTNNTLTKIIVLDQIHEKDYSMLVNEFGYGKDRVDASVKMYRNIALVLNLVQKGEGEKDWKTFVNRHIPKKEKISKLDNTFVSKNCEKVLIVTNRRLVSVDLKNLNEKIRKINTDIEILNDSLAKEIEPEEKRTFMATLKGMFN
ncbi:MAG: hypothetical protein QF824_04675 [Candidatus Woesearchaeota archaeon]|jgi:hypothetical protein|nr:hypothetical protein [Candidatus Woesearchaeota archaeon]